MWYRLKLIDLSGIKETKKGIIEIIESIDII